MLFLLKKYIIIYKIIEIFVSEFSFYSIFLGGNIMEFLTSTILSGITYDLIKKGVTITADILRKKLTNWIFKDEDLAELSKAINTATEFDKKTDKYWEAFLDSNEDIQNISKRIQKQINTQIYQDLSTANITGDNVTNVVNNYNSNNNNINNYFYNLNNENDSKKKQNV